MDRLKRKLDNDDELDEIVERYEKDMEEATKKDGSG